MQGESQGLNPPSVLVQQLARVILGKDEVLKRLALAVLVGGHVLIEDVPGVGKTTLAKALAHVLGAQFRRIQFTPDLLPYDITGFDVFQPETRTFEFHPGPIFAQVVLADEINRATPKVQAALLEVMEEHQVTSGTTTRPLDKFFLVIATQNPAGNEGTYPLPAAQLDRFTLGLSMGYPEPLSERAVWLGDPGHHLGLANPGAVAPEAFLDLRQGLDSIHISPAILDLVGKIIQQTRQHSAIRLGLSPRAGVHLIKAARGWAWMHGRDFVTAQDIHDLATDVWSHRLELVDDSLGRRQVLSAIVDEELSLHEA